MGDRPGNVNVINNTELYMQKSMAVHSTPCFIYVEAIQKQLEFRYTLKQPKSQNKMKSHHFRFNLQRII